MRALVWHGRKDVRVDRVPDPELKADKANVKRWIDDLLPLVEDERDPLGVEDLATHGWPLDAAPEAHSMFQEKRDGAIKVVLRP